MRNIERLPKPKSLINNASKWTRALLDEVGRCGGNAEVVSEKFFNKYNKKSIKKALKTMYDGFCCYCESRIGVVDFPHIEHHKPKRRFPNYTYDWNNLHLACTQCNIAKGEQYDIGHPILDPVIDVPISDHLEHELAWISPKTRRGAITEKHAALNRDELFDARQIIFIEVMRVIDKINGHPEDPSNGVRMQQLRKKCKGEYGTLIEYIMERFIR